VNLAAIFAVIIGIPVGGRGNLAPSSFVWGSVIIVIYLHLRTFDFSSLSQIIDQSGWNNRPFVFLLGLLSVQWVMVRSLVTKTAQACHDSDDTHG
jgi:hypothetical protein